jgi:hypothetical protein
LSGIFSIDRTRLPSCRWFGKVMPTQAFAMQRITCNHLSRLPRCRPLLARRRLAAAAAAHSMRSARNGSRTRCDCKSPSNPRCGTHLTRSIQRRRC